MKRIFITYGDHNYEDSLQRIKAEAEATGIFDKIIIYTPDNLPEPFKGYTTKYKRGGGYWLWKPYIIKNTLDNANDGDIIVYVDAGCTVQKSKDWFRYFNRLRSKSGIFFIACGKSQKWCKKEVFDLFHTRNNLWKHANQIQATFIIIKKTADNDVVDRWFEAAKSHPSLFTDVEEEERGNEDKCFKEHRHDQSVLTACVCTSDNLLRYSLIPEKMEKIHAGGQAVVASRISSQGRRSTNPTQALYLDVIERYILNPIKGFITKALFLLSRF